MITARNFARRLLRDKAGSSVIETAIVLPTFLLLMAGATDLASGYYTKLQTQQAAARSVELGNVGGMERLSADDMKAEAASAARVSSDNVTVNRWLECNGTTQTLFEGSCAEGEVTARYVSVRIRNSYRPILGSFLPNNWAPDGTVPFEGFASLRLQ